MYKMKYKTSVILIVVLFLMYNDEAGAHIAVFPSDEDAYPVVHTPVGNIRGLRAEDGNYSMFMGIPYAQVDPDNLFGNAKPYPSFENTFDAFDDSSICPQQEEFNYTIVGSLDCLHINVFVPDSASNQNQLPVLVWIFGGSFNIGFPGRFLYGPSFLVRHDIILVTINYRLGPYGFMCLDIPEVPGNQGLQDQVMALKWIKNNIGAFDGDNNRITIGGNSAGGMSADLLLHYGQDDNLYHKIILQSGVILVQNSISNPDPTAPFKLASFLNYNATDVKDALSFLATVDPHQLIAATNELGTISFGPCIEYEFENVERFITEYPVNMNVPKVRDIEVLIGLLSEESYVAMTQIADTMFPFVDFVGIWTNRSFDFEGEDELYAEMHRIVTNFYFSDEDITAALRQQVVDFTSDFNFNYPILKTVKRYLDNGVQTMYLYMFSYSGQRNFSKHRMNITGGGAAHADELGYLFDISYMDKPLDPEDELVVNRMTELWANFVKYGNPTPEPTELIPVVWQPVTSDKWHYLELDTELRVATRPFHARTAFLDLFYKMNEIYQRGYDREPEESGPSSGKNLVSDLCLSVLVISMNFLINIILKNVF